MLCENTLWKVGCFSGIKSGMTSETCECDGPPRTEKKDTHTQTVWHNDKNRVIELDDLAAMLTREDP